MIHKKPENTLASGRMSSSSELASRAFEAARSGHSPFNGRSGPATPNFFGVTGQAGSQTDRYVVNKLVQKFKSSPFEN